MSLKGVDTAAITINHAHNLYNNYGVRALGFYLRSDRAPLAMVQGLHSVGIKLWSIWEEGDPITPSYFTASKGKEDGLNASWYAEKIFQPAGTALFACFDYDSKVDEVLAYAEAFHASVRQNGYLMGAYGNGVTLQYLLDHGFAHYTMLSQSTGFTGYEEFKPKADIVQGVGVTVDGLNCDWDTVNNELVLW